MYELNSEGIMLSKNKKKHKKESRTLKKMPKVTIKPLALKCKKTPRKKIKSNSNSLPHLLKWLPYSRL